MEGSEYQFYWPGIINALPVFLIFVVLPVWLLILFFRYTRLSLFKKWILVPACILGPFLSTLIWPFIIYITGLIRMSPNGARATYLWVGTELFKDWSEYVWGGISTIAVYILHRSVKTRKLATTKYFFIPLTMFLWYLTTYYGLYIAIIGITFMFSISLFWLVLGYLFFICIIFGISTGIPGLLRLLILKIYGINWLSSIMHALAGIIGLVQLVRFFSANPPELVVKDETFFILTGMWKISPVKTVFLTPLFFGLVISLLWSTIIVPIHFRISGEHI